MTTHERPLEDVRNTLSEYVRVLRRRWRLGLIGLGLVASMAFWYSQYLPRRYSASTIFERRDDVVLRNLVHSRSPYSFDNLKSTIVMDTTGSRAMAAATATLGLLPAEAITSEGAATEAKLRAADRILSRYDLRASLQLLHTSSNLDTIRLECRANDPVIASRFVVALRDGYIARTRERINDILVSTRQFFEDEIERIRRELAESKRGLSEQFKDFPGVDPTDLPAVGAKLVSLQQEREQHAYRKAELEAQISAREEFLLSFMTMPAPATESTHSQSSFGPPAVKAESEAVVVRAIGQVEQQIADALSVGRMTEAHPTVRGLRRKLDVLQATLADVRERQQAAVPPTAQVGVPNVAADLPAATHAAQAGPRVGQATSTPITGQRVRSTEQLRIELELEAYRRQLQVVQTSYEQADRRAREFEALYGQFVQRSEELRKIRDKIDQDTLTIATWRDHLGQLNRILAAESEDRGTLFALIEEPGAAYRAVSPRLASVFAVCTGSGLAVAVLLVALSELLDRSFRSTGQVSRALGVPVLECVGVIPTPRVRRRRILSRLLWTPTLALLIGMLVFSSGLAYTSLEQPRLYRKAMARLERVSQTMVPPPARTPEVFGGQ